MLILIVMYLLNVYLSITISFILPKIMDFKCSLFLSPLPLFVHHIHFIPFYIFKQSKINDTINEKIEKNIFSRYSAQKYQKFYYSYAHKHFLGFCSHGQNVKRIFLIFLPKSCLWFLMVIKKVCIFSYELIFKDPSLSKNP